MLKIEMKEKYEEGNWIALGKDDDGINKNNWVKLRNPTFSNFKYYRIIHKKHEHILDAYINKCQIYVVDPFSEEIVLLKDDFIYFYCNSDIYYATPNTLNNCYCDANEVHFNELYKSINQKHKWYLQDLTKFLFIHDDYFYWNNKFDNIINNESYKKIEINKQLNKWVYCSYIKGKEMGITGINCEGSVQQEENIKFEDMNTFNERGFKTPKFKGEILKEVDNFYIGYIKINNDYIVAKKWLKSGKSADQKAGDLTPIEKKWYEKEENINRLVYVEKLDLYGIFNKLCTRKDGKYILINNTCYNKDDVRLATDKEIKTMTSCQK